MLKVEPTTPAQGRASDSARCSDWRPERGSGSRPPTLSGKSDQVRKAASACAPRSVRPSVDNLLRVRARL